MGTSSAAIAFALGRPDGAQAVSRERHLENAKLIGRLTDLPVNGDTEDGFVPAPADVVATVDSAIDAGLAGVAIEDTTANPEMPIHTFDDAVQRVRHAAKIAKGLIVLTGRTDAFLFGMNDLDAVIRRLVAFAEVGADVLYSPNPRDMDAVRAIVKAVAPKPVNLNISPASGVVSVAELHAAGVRRISFGAAPYRHAMSALKEALEAGRKGNLIPVASGIPFGVITKMLTSAP